MRDTRATLLLRLRDRDDRPAWAEFHRLYAPLLYRYARGRGLTRVDAEEIRDQCLLVVARKIESFEYSEVKGGFKNWLYCIANGKVVDFLRKRREPAERTRVLRVLPDPQPTPEELWDRQWQYQHVVYCAAQLKDTINATYYRAFEMLAFEGREVDEVCAELELTPNQVHTAKSRVLRRIRAEIEKLGLTI